MKKILTITLVLFLFIPVLAVADLPDVTGYTDQELKDMIMACSEELRSRSTTDPDGIMVFNNGGIRVYQIGEAYISSSGRLKIPVIVYNDLDDKITISIVDPTLNDYVVHGYIYPQLPPHSKAKDELDFSSEDAELTSLEDIYSLIFGWQVYSATDWHVILDPTDREEHRFW